MNSDPTGLKSAPPQATPESAEGADAADAEPRSVSLGSDEAKEPRAGLRVPDQLVAAALATIMLILIIVRWLDLGGRGLRTVEIREMAPVENRFRLDVNTADEVQWAQLTGVGDILAAKIVEDRRANGPFRSIGDLTRVDGIGPQTLERIKPWLTINQSN